MKKLYDELDEDMSAEARIKMRKEIKEQMKNTKAKEKAIKDMREQQEMDLRTKILTLAAKKAKKKLIIASFVFCIFVVLSEYLSKSGLNMSFNPIIAFMIILVITYFATSNERKAAEMEVLNEIDEIEDVSVNE